jgi:hypothetical protein
MLNLISRIIGRIVPIFLIGVVLLTTNIERSFSEKLSGKKLDQVVAQDIHQDNEKRPKTTGEWNQQSRETQGKPGERLKRIGEQSAEAVKDFGAMFPDTAKRSATELESK